MLLIQNFSHIYRVHITVNEASLVVPPPKQFGECLQRTKLLYTDSKLGAHKVYSDWQLLSEVSGRERFPITILPVMWELNLGPLDCQADLYP